MTNIEAARVLSAVLKKQQELPEKYRDLTNQEMLALGKAITTLRAYYNLQQNEKRNREPWKYGY